MSATTAGVRTASLVLWVFRVDHGVCWWRSLLGSWLNYFVPAESAMRCCLFPPSLLYAYRTTFPCPVFKWHSPCNWLGDLCMVVQIKSHCARSKEGIFTQTKLNLQFEEMQKRLSHILCQRLHPWPHWCTTPRSLPLAVTPQSLGRPLQVLMPLSFLPLPPTSFIIGIKQ